jgi:hypothetical protein
MKITIRELRQIIKEVLEQNPELVTEIGSNWRVNASGKVRWPGGKFGGSTDKYRSRDVKIGTSVSGQSEMTRREIEQLFPSAPTELSDFLRQHKLSKYSAAGSDYFPNVRWYKMNDPVKGQNGRLSMGQSYIRVADAKNPADEFAEWRKDSGWALTGGGDVSNAGAGAMKAGSWNRSGGSTSSVAATASAPPPSGPNWIPVGDTGKLVNIDTDEVWDPNTQVAAAPPVAPPPPRPSKSAIVPTSKQGVHKRIKK